MAVTESVRTALDSHPLLRWATLASLGIGVVAAVGVVADPRELVGAPIWMKSLKFSISIAIYCVTLALLLPVVTRGRRVARTLCSLIAVGVVFELVMVSVQIVRGTLSHYNFQTPLDTTIMATMGAVIVAVWCSNIVLAGFVLASRGPDAPLTVAVRFGLVIGLVGMALAFTMTTAEIGLIHNPSEGIHGAHSVGTADGGPGLPFVGWSTVAGDLRVPHFVGLHAMQAVPVALLFVRALLLRTGWAAAVRTTIEQRLAVVIGLGYAGLVMLAFWQAARGQSVVRPDIWTMLAASALVVLVGCSAVAVLAAARHRVTADPAGPVSAVAAVRRGGRGRQPAAAGSVVPARG